MGCSGCGSGRWGEVGTPGRPRTHLQSVGSKEQPVAGHTAEVPTTIHLDAMGGGGEGRGEIGTPRPAPHSRPLRSQLMPQGQGHGGDSPPPHTHTRTQTHTPRRRAFQQRCPARCPPRCPPQRWSGPRSARPRSHPYEPPVVGKAHVRNTGMEATQSQVSHVARTAVDSVTRGCSGSGRGGWQTVCTCQCVFLGVHYGTTRERTWVTPIEHCVATVAACA